MRRESPFDVLPEGLPPGRLITPEQSGRPVLWISDEPLPDAGPQWARLFALHERTGLYPLLLDTLRGEPGRPWHDGEGAEDPEPSGPWPGLAPAGEPDLDADTAAAELAASLGSSRHWLLGLVPAARGADTVTLCGWTGPMNHTNHTQEISTVLRSWEERFGARVVSVGFATLQVSVSAPPRTEEHAYQITAEHLGFCPDNLWQGCGDFAMYADGLVDEEWWSFWWD